MNKINNIKVYKNINKLEFLLKDLHIKFKSKNLNIDNFNSLYNISGVWAIWGTNNKDRKSVV